MSHESPYLTWQEAAAYLGLSSKSALRGRIRRGTLPRWCWTNTLGELRFIRSALDQWMAEGAQDQRTEAVERLRRMRGLLSA